MEKQIIPKQFFRDQIAIVTGASSGIGRATALELAKHGACLGLGARNLQALDTLAEEIRGLGRQAIVLPTDVTQKDQVQHLVDQVVSRWNKLDILVSNAGQYIRSPIIKMDLATLERSMAVNFYGGVYAIQAVLPHMLARRSGHIVLVSSMDGKKGMPPDAPYAAAKFALSGFGEVLRQELYGTGVHVTIVFPGRVDTPMVGTLDVPRISAKITPEAVAQAIRKAILRKKAEVIIPSQARPLYYLNVFSPRLADWFVRILHLEGKENQE